MTTATFLLFWLSFCGMCFSAQNSIDLLNGLTGTNGWKFYGTNSGSQIGRTITSGDINGDSISDIAIGVFSESSPSKPQSGSTYVIFGKRTNFPVGLELSRLNGRIGFKINGANSYEGSGISVSLGGDVNGDGIGDMIIGAFGASPGGRVFSGSCFVLFGKTGGFAPVIELEDLNGTNGFKINGEKSYDYSGCSVSLKGDVNGDGIDDILIGASSASPDRTRTSAGKAYVVFGKSSGFSSSLELSSLNGANGFSVNGAHARDNLGQTVKLGADVNGDSISDILIGANSRRGGYVIYGKTSGFLRTIELSTLNVRSGFALVLPMPTIQPSSDTPGLSLDLGPDVNGDGICDLIVGAYTASPNDVFSAGIAYVVFGRRDFPSRVILDGLDGGHGFRLEGSSTNERFGFSVNIGGDVNGDRFGDILIGSVGASPRGRLYSGATHVIFGKSTAFDEIFSVLELDGSNGYSLHGGSVGDNLGSALTSADINADGLADVVVGSSNESPGFRTQAGAGYLIYGKSQD